MATVQRYAAAYNRGDIKGEVALCASPAEIIDDFAPHAWQGATACADWASASAASNRAAGITDTRVALLEPWHVIVTGDRAYADVPTNFTYKQHGTPMMEHASIWTFALRKTSAGWRITGWSWAQH